MPYLTFPCAVIGAVFVLCLHLAPAEAQEPFFVATTGSDSNSCLTPAQACKTLQRAHNVAVSGFTKIVVLDSGDFGIVTITKSIAIAATGAHAHLFGGFYRTAIIIETGPDDVIDIDGLAMGDRLPLNFDNSGIDFVSGGRLNVRNCAIRNFGTGGIRVRPGGSKRVHVSDCTIANNWHGIWAAGNAEVFLDRVTVEGNARDGVRSQGRGARVRINNSTIANNRTGLNAVNGGRLISFGNNAIHGNTTNGAPTATVSLK